VTSGGAWMIAVLAVPLAAAVAALLAGRRGAAAAGLLGSVLGTATVLGLAAAVLTDGMQRVIVGGWAAPLGIELRADGLSTAMLLMTAVVGAGIALYAWRYFGASHAAGTPHTPEAAAGAANDRQEWLFWPVWLLAWGALNALYLSGDLFNLYVTLELLGLAAVALVALAGAGAAAAALRYLLLALLGSMLYILGVELLYAAHQTLDLQQLRERVQPSLSVGLAAALMTAGLLVKTAVFPLHFWLPPAHGSAPAPVSAALPDDAAYAARFRSNAWDDWRVRHTIRTLLGVSFMKRNNTQAFDAAQEACVKFESAQPASVRQVLDEWKTARPHAGGMRPLTGMVARVLLREKRTAEALALYEIACTQVPQYTSWYLEYLYFTLACREVLNGTLLESDREQAAAGIGSRICSRQGPR